MKCQLCIFICRWYLNFHCLSSWYFANVKSFSASRVTRTSTMAAVSSSLTWICHHDAFSKDLHLHVWAYTLWMLCLEAAWSQLEALTASCLALHDSSSLHGSDLVWVWQYNNALLLTDSKVFKIDEWRAQLFSASLSSVQWVRKSLYVLIIF